MRTTLLAATIAAFAAAPAMAQDALYTVDDMLNACQAAYDTQDFDHTRDAHNVACGCMSGHAQSDLSELQVHVATAGLSEDPEAMARVQADMTEADMQALQTFFTETIQDCDPTAQ